MAIRPPETASLAFDIERWTRTGHAPVTDHVVTEEPLETVAVAVSIQAPPLISIHGSMTGAVQLLAAAATMTGREAVAVSEPEVAVTVAV